MPDVAPYVSKRNPLKDTMMRYRTGLILAITFLTAACKPTAPTTGVALPSAPLPTLAINTSEKSQLVLQSNDTEVFSSSVSPVRAEEIVKEVMNQEYGDHFDAKLRCWAYTAELANGSFDYCMRPGLPKLVKAKGTEQLYFLAASRADINDGPNYSYSQSDSGLMGAFQIEIESPVQWKLLAGSKDLDYGSAGNCGCQDAEFVKLGADYYGWKFASGGIWQGVASLTHNLVAPYKNEFKDISVMPRVREDDQSVEYRIKIDDTAPGDRVYPLLITRTKAGTTLERIRVNFDHQEWQYAFPIHKTNDVETSRPSLVEAVAKTVTGTSRHTHDAASPQQTLHDGGDTQIQPRFRKSFDKCWHHASDVASKMNCIKTELAYHDSTLNKNYKVLHKVLSDRDWLSLREDQRQWHPSTRKACESHAGTAQQKLDSDYCILYRTALRAYELEIMLDLESDYQDKAKGEL
ncbi:MAG: lysozyme inhibitor LprI family protein [Luteimonas sp.]